MAAWEWLTSPLPGSETERLYHWQPVVEDQLLAHGDDAALLDAVAVLEAHGCFGWEQSQPALMQRVIAALSRAGGDHAIAAAILQSNRVALPQLPSTGDKGDYAPMSTPTPSSGSPQQQNAHLALRVHMMPKDTNVQGTIFGGVILSLIDQAGFYESRLHGLHRWGHRVDGWRRVLRTSVVRRHRQFVYLNQACWPNQRDS